MNRINIIIEYSCQETNIFTLMLGRYKLKKINIYHNMKFLRRIVETLN